MRAFTTAAVWCALACAHAGRAPAAEPQIDYMLNCMGCHTADGHGSPGKIPALRSTLAPLAVDPAGRRYLVEVPGVAQSELSDAAIAQLLNWMVRNLASEPVGFVDFTAAEVTRYRAQRLTSVARTRAELMARMGAGR